MTLDIDALTRTLREFFPVKGRHGDMDVAGSWSNPDLVAESNGRGDVLVTFRLMTWGVYDGVRSIRDIKEQTIWFIPAEHAVAGPRLEAYIEGHAHALKQVLDNFREIETLMPHDLIHARILMLKRPQSAEDFARALSVKSRLGRLMVSDSELDSQG